MIHRLSKFVDVVHSLQQGVHITGGALVLQANKTRLLSGVVQGNVLWRIDSDLDLQYINIYTMSKLRILIIDKELNQALDILGFQSVICCLIPASTTNLESSVGGPKCAYLDFDGIIHYIAFRRLQQLIKRQERSESPVILPLGEGMASICNVGGKNNNKYTLRVGKKSGFYFACSPFPPMSVSSFNML